MKVELSNSLLVIKYLGLKLTNGKKKILYDLQFSNERKDEDMFICIERN